MVKPIFVKLAINLNALISQDASAHPLSVEEFQHAL